MNTYSLSNFKVGMEFAWDFSFDYKDMINFRKLSGDINPIHSNREFAISKGFDSPVIYGLLLSSQISKLVGTCLPSDHVMLTGFNIIFSKPSYIGDNLRFVSTLDFLSEATLALHFKFEILKDGIRVCSGNIDSVYRP